MEWNGQPTVTIEQARSLTGVSRRTIYNWMAKNQVQFVRTSGGRVRILRDSLHLTKETQVTEKFCEAGTV